MTRAGGTALLALMLVAGVGDAGKAQQDLPRAPRHHLPTDTTKVQPFQRSYEIVVHSGDSATIVGRREVIFTAATYSGSPAWLIVESRTGVVPAVESLYLARDLRPLHWSSVVGLTHLGAQFVGDTIYGAVVAPPGKQNVLLTGRSDLVSSLAMLEVLFPLLPLTSTWTDSASVLEITVAHNQVLPVELIVLNDEEFALGSMPPRQAWVVVLRSQSKRVLFWIDKNTGAALRILQPLSADVGTELEYRARLEPGAPTSPSQRS